MVQRRMALTSESPQTSMGEQEGASSGHRNNTHPSQKAITPAPQNRRSFNVHTSLLFDPQQKAFLENRSITVDPCTGLVTKYFQRQSKDTTENTDDDVDLRHLPAVVPGLVDAHTHIFLHPYAEASSTVQMRDESPTERTIRAVTHVRKALMAGYTTYRDLGTEAVGDADVGVRDAINRGLIPGPRIYAATQALASTGGYQVRGENPATQMPAASDMADGIDGVRKAVRRRIGVGADVIKVYADYRRRVMRFPGPDIQFPPGGSNTVAGGPRNPNVVLWSQEELDTLVQEANLANCPVAAHCGSNEAVKMAAKAGVTSIEHGNEAGEEALMAIKNHGCIFVPTLAVMELFYQGEELIRLLTTARRAWELGIPLATGGDTGPFPHGDNAREIELMLKAGLPLEEVLYAATVGGWNACGGNRCGRRFGWWEEGCAADFVGLRMDPRDGSEALRQVDFVMKDGKVVKKGGENVWID
ncbi:hypothetical protein MMC20_005475 [Loxospora ochrophaea]|nr:hypothetical protein [Loxospora ochrophaea]